MTLKLRAFSAIRWTTFSTVLRSALQLFQVVVLARLLAPEQFGAIALMMATAALIQTFNDMGVSTALIHERDVSDEHLSSLFWLSVATGALLTFLLLCAAPLLGHAFNMPSLTSLLQTIALVFLISSAGQQLRVMSEKRLRFKRIALLEVASACVGTAVAISWALFRPEAMALAVGMLASAVATTILAWSLLSDGWRPQLRLRVSEIRKYLKLGGYTVATNLTNTAVNQVDVLVGGRYLSAEQLGLFGLPRDLTLRLAWALNPIVTRVATPVLSEVQLDRSRLKHIYLRSLWVTSSVNFPLYMGIAAFAPELIHLVFGPSWMPSAPLLQLLAVWGLIRSTGNPVGSLLYATGRAELAFSWCLLVLLVASTILWFSASWGAIGLACGLIAIQILLFVPGWAFLIKPLCGAGLGEYVGALAVPFAVAAASILPALLVAEFLVSPPMRLFAGVALAATLYFVFSAWINRQLLNELRTLFQFSTP
jgi:O-antigen/teichoic acid export membrane protein